MSIKAGALRKPPIGLTPRKIYKEATDRDNTQRLKEINAAIARYNAAFKSIPSAWLEEKKEIEKARQ